MQQYNRDCHINIPNVVISPCESATGSVSDLNDQLEVTSLSGSSISNLSTFDKRSLYSVADAASIYSNALGSDCEEFLSNFAPGDNVSIYSGNQESNIYTITNSKEGTIINDMEVKTMDSSVKVTYSGLKLGLLIFSLVFVLVIFMIFFI